MITGTEILKVMDLPGTTETTTIPQTLTTPTTTETTAGLRETTAMGTVLHLTTKNMLKKEIDFNHETPITPLFPIQEKY